LTAHASWWGTWTRCALGHVSRPTQVLLRPVDAV
jgi:hypothetical protein